MGTLIAGFVVAVASAPSLRPPPDALSLIVPAARGGPPHLFRIDPATGDAKNVTNSQTGHELFPAVSPDARRIAYVVGGVNQDARVWVANADGTGAKAVTQAEAGAKDQGPAWSPDGRRLAYARMIRPLKWELRVCNADGSDDSVVQDAALCPAWSPDGKRVAFAAFDPEAKTARVAVMNPDGSDVKFLTPPLGALEMVSPAWSADGRVLAFSAPAATATGHAVELHAVNADGTGLRRLTHLGNASLYPVWVSDRELLFAYLSREMRGYLTIRADGTRLQVHPLSKFDAPHELSRASVFRPQPPVKPAPEPNPVRPASHAEPIAVKSPKIIPVGWSVGNGVELSWAPTGQGFAAAGADGRIGLAEAEAAALRPVGMLPGHPGGTFATAWSADGNRLYSFGADKLVRAWSTTTREAVATAADGEDAGFGLAVDPRGTWVANGTRVGKVTVRDAEKLKPRTSFELIPGRKPEIGALLASPDGKTLYAAGGVFTTPISGGAVVAFDPETGQEKWRAKGTFGGLVRAALSADGKKLAGACVDTSVRVWDATTGAELARWTGHGERVTAVAWSPDGKTVASGSLDHTVRLWDATTGAPVLTLAAHLAPVVRVTFSGDGKNLATVGPDRVMVWRLE